MCVAIYKPADKSITKEVLKNCYDNNSDGCGFAYINTDRRGKRRLKIKKTLSFKTFWDQYSKAVSLAPDSPFIIHFRIKTHGPINIENCHPFRIDKNHVFIHNGTIKGMTSDKDRSDTNRFNIDYLRKLPKGWWDNEGIINMISHIIDYGKVVLMNIDGDVQICNEKKGDWVDGVWFSNTSYKKTPSNTSSFNSRSTTSYSGYSGRGYNQDAYIGGNWKKTSTSCFKCAGCSKTMSLVYLTGYFDSGEVVAYCHECNKRILKEFPQMVEYELTEDALLDYFNSPYYMKFNKSYFRMDKEWVNPWKDIEDDEVDDMIEREETYENQYPLVIS